jgi:hypothetical protein
MRGKKSRIAHRCMKYKPQKRIQKQDQRNKHNSGITYTTFNIIKPSFYFPHKKLFEIETPG